MPYSLTRGRTIRPAARYEQNWKYYFPIHLNMLNNVCISQSNRLPLIEQYLLFNETGIHSLCLIAIFIIKTLQVLSEGWWMMCTSVWTELIKSPQYTWGDFMFLYRFVRRRRRLRRRRRRPQILVHAITFEQLFGYLSFLTQLLALIYWLPD